MAKRQLSTVLTCLLAALLLASPARAQIIETIGGSISSVDSADPRQIPLVISRAVAVDPSGSYLYIGDDGTRKIGRAHV